MSTELTYKTSTSNAEETKSLAAKIGRQIKGGEVFVLNGDLGFGKTVFVKGLAHGAGIDAEVTSPSFTISNLYAGDRVNIYHMDYYRIHEAGVLVEELLEIMQDKRNVVAIEWPDIMADWLPEDTVKVKLISQGDEKRDIEFVYPEKFKYLFEGAK